MPDDLELPDIGSLPITTGPPKQKEPRGHTLSGPPPETIPKELALLAQVNLRTLLVPRALPIVSGQDAIREMQKFIGTGESPAGSNCNALTHRAGLGCCAWCDITVWTAWWNAGFNMGNHIQVPGVATDYWFGDAYVPNTMRHFQAAGRFSPTPVPGAAGVHYWGGGEGNSHIVMYCNQDATTVLNIEGNHNNVCEYVRRPKQDSTRKGYCIPPFSTASPVPAPTPGPDPRVALRRHKKSRYRQVEND